MKRRVRTLSGTKSQAVTAREISNRQVAREAAAEGIVLMKNDGILPLAKNSRLAVFGSGAGQTVKGGTGSGDVNERETVNIGQGLVNAGFEVTSKEWIEDFREIYKKSRQEWRRVIKEDVEKNQREFFTAYASHAYEMPDGRAIKEEDFGGADTAVYVISRIAGEAADRHDKAGDYYLTEHEKEDLRVIADGVQNVIVVLNTGGQIDLKDILAIEKVRAILSVSQPGMEGGNALADVLTGDVTPSGKLTDTWAKAYSDFPNWDTFSHKNNNIQTEKYEEGIYVGYRYFDSFQVEVEYPFGFGLSYTDFQINTGEILADSEKVSLQVTVENTGTEFSGKEVVQVYVSCPQDRLPKEYRRLCAFGKTKLLKPGEKETLSLNIPAKALASFHENESAWIAERGLYGIWVGNSLKDAVLSGVVEMKEDVVLETVKHICPLKEELEELVRPEDTVRKLEASWHKEAKDANRIPVVFAPEKSEIPKILENDFSRQAEELVEKLSDEELISMVIGEVSKGQDNVQDNALGSAGIMVPGAAGETSGILEEKWDVPGISMADGPAGLRLLKSYDVDRESKRAYGGGILGALEGGFFAEHCEHENADTYYQYCTAFPVGAMLAQTWNVGLLEKVGRAVAKEMQEFGVAWWLAPGMNIHRNPLCGRNFEYYSEDPLVSGTMAAAITRGVQSVEGVGTTIKHFACNNQEDNRMGSNSVLSERTLREIYLRGFEIAVKTSQPMAIMTSYNLINGVHAANCRDTCTVAAREEWDFQGIIMTDWTTTLPCGGSLSWKCASAGNDLIMPGFPQDGENIRKALDEGLLDREDLKACVKRMLKVIYQTLGYEGCASYGSQFRF